MQAGSAAEVLAERTIYGESLSASEMANHHHHRKVYQVKDGTGVATNVEYDFKGNKLESQ